MDLTIIIPTKNRPEFIKKQLIYYRNQNFKGKILFLDSSSKKIFNNLKKYIVINDYKNTQIFNVMGTSFDTFKSKAKMIKTKYVLFSGDDDFYIVKSLTKMIRNLKNSSEFIGITGKALQIETGGTNNDKVLSYNFYNINSNMHRHPLNRLKQITKNYSVVLFSILNTKKFLEIVHNVPASHKMHFTFQTEVLPCFLIALSGRIKKVKNLFLFRLVGHRRITHETLGQLKKNNFFNKSYILCINIIYNFLKIKNKNKNTKFKIKNYIESYFTYSNFIQQKFHLKKKFVKLILKIIRLILSENFHFNLKKYFFHNEVNKILRQNKNYNESFNFLRNTIIKND